MARGRVSLQSRLSHLWPELQKKDRYAAILCGEVRVDGERIRDPKALVDREAHITRVVNRFVSRGGEKLEGALDALGLNPAGKVCLDAGASTGGFTDCLLSRRACCVHAVDVGRNQLAWKLRTDPRVVVREKTNIMDLARDDLRPPPQFVVADLSFRSLRGAASQLVRLGAGAVVLALAKPQFEHPVEKDFDGVVRSREVREAVLRSLHETLPREGAHIHDAAPSLLPGRGGNVEVFLLLAGKPPADEEKVMGRIRRALDASAYRRP